VSRSGKLLIAGFAVLLVIGIALWQMAKTGEATASVDRAAKPEPPTATATPEPASKQEPAAAPAADAAPFKLPSKSTTPRPSIADKVAVPQEEEIPRRPDGKVIGVADLDVLRDANAPTDQLVRDCIAKHGGATVSGTLMTTFVVARKREPNGTFKVETETTGFEEDESTLRDPVLVECMHKTALAMKFPTNTSPLATWARREMTVKDGVLTQNWVIKHGYIH
jgi:hypothetical protein